MQQLKLNHLQWEGIGEAVGVETAVSHRLCWEWLTETKGHHVCTEQDEVFFQTPDKAWTAAKKKKKKSWSRLKSSAPEMLRKQIGRYLF